MHYLLSTIHIHHDFYAIKFRLTSQVMIHVLVYRNIYAAEFPQVIIHVLIHRNVCTMKVHLASQATIHALVRHNICMMKVHLASQTMIHVLFAAISVRRNFRIYQNVNFAQFLWFYIRRSF